MGGHNKMWLKDYRFQEVIHVASCYKKYESIL